MHLMLVLYAQHRGSDGCGRQLLQDPGEAYAGSQLQGLEVQVVDEKGDVDKRMDGSLHSLTLDWNSKAPVPLTLGVGKLPAIDLPVVPGTWRGRVSHAAHPELFTFLEASEHKLKLRLVRRNVQEIVEFPFLVEVTRKSSCNQSLQSKDDAILDHS